MFAIPFELERTIVIAKTPVEISTALADFKVWARWSPWLILEPSCHTEIEGTPGQEGHAQSWDGRRIGSGRMRLLRLEPGKLLELEVLFLKPWKSRSSTAFRLEPVEGGTRVTWSMKGTLPIFLFFMKKMMSAYVGGDYERGLGMLKEYLETGKVHSRVEIKGEAPREAFHFVAVARSCGIHEVGPLMHEDFTGLGRQVDAGSLPRPDFTFSFYDKYDMVTKKCAYRAGLGYRVKPTITGAAGLEVGSVPAHRAFQVDHFGTYRHLGNGWTALMMCARQEKAKASKDISMYEVYRSMPGQAPDPEIHTEIFQPLR